MAKIWLVRLPIGSPPSVCLAAAFFSAPFMALVRWDIVGDRSPDGRFAPNGNWDASNARVFVGWFVVGGALGFLGVRSEVG